MVIVILVEIRVDHPCILSQIKYVKQFQSIFTNQLVIQINQQKYISSCTMFGDGYMNVFQSCFTSWIFNIFELLFCNFIELKVGKVNRLTVIIGGIVDNNCYIIGVVLRENGVQIKLYSEFVCIVSAHSHNTHR